MMKSKKDQKEVPCPKCGAKAHVVPILYGMPTYEAFLEEQKGNLIIGGCIGDENLKWYCKKCKREF